MRDRLCCAHLRFRSETKTETKCSEILNIFRGRRAVVPPAAIRLRQFDYRLAGVLFLGMRKADVPVMKKLCIAIDLVFRLYGTGVFGNRSRFHLSASHKNPYIKWCDLPDDVGENLIFSANHVKTFGHEGSQPLAIHTSPT